MTRVPDAGRRYYLKDIGLDDRTAAGVGELIDQLERQLSTHATKDYVKTRISRLEAKLTRWITSRLLWPLYGLLVAVVGLLVTIAYRLFSS